MMKKLIIVPMVMVMFSFQGLNAAIAAFGSCEDSAFAYAEIVYNQTGNGLDAGAAFVAYETLCNAGFINPM